MILSGCLLWGIEEIREGIREILQYAINEQLSVVKTHIEAPRGRSLQIKFHAILLDLTSRRISNRREEFLKPNSFRPKLNLLSAVDVTFTFANES